MKNFGVYSRLCLFSLILLCYSVLTNAQKYDLNWIGGMLTGELGGEAYLIKFDNHDLLGIDTLFVRISPTFGQVSISDPLTGNLLFYSNGNYLVNSEHSIMDNGGGLNAMSAWRDRFGSYNPYCNYCYLVTPNKHQPGIYYLLHPLMKVSAQVGFRVTSSKLQITKVDMNYNSGMGKVVYKDSVLLDQWTSTRFSVVQHANGQDWWIITRSENGEFYRVLLFGDDELISDQISYQLDPSSYLKTYDDSVVTASIPFVVSPNGDIILDRQGTSHMRMLSFDRCSGDIRYLKDFQIPMDAYYTPRGNPRSKLIESNMGVFAISPSGMYAYAWGANGLYQWDLSAEDISGSRLTVFGPPVVLDQDQMEDLFNVTHPFPVHSPDGKIYYLNAWNHYIVHRPDERGVAAEVEGPRALGQNIYFDSPNYPNYRLGPLRGSICDTLLSSDVNYGKGGEFTLYPNPTEGQVTVELDLISWDRDDVTLSVYDALGRQLYRHVYNRWSYIHEIEAGTLPPGVYFVRLELGTVPVQTQRLVVSR